jgi:hypothetical protein
MLGQGKCQNGSKLLPHMKVDNTLRSRRMAKGLPTAGRELRPEDFAVGSRRSRAAARALLSENQKRIALIFDCKDLPLNLETSTCVRNMSSDSTIIEVVCIDGNVGEITEAELDQFILQHPICYEP